MADKMEKTKMSDRLGELYGSFLSRCILVLDEERLVQALMRVDAARPVAAEAKARAEETRQAAAKAQTKAAQCRQMLEEVEKPTRRASEAREAARSLRSAANDLRKQHAVAVSGKWTLAKRERKGLAGCLGCLSIPIYFCISVACPVALRESYGQELEEVLGRDGYSALEVVVWIGSFVLMWLFSRMVFNVVTTIKDAAPLAKEAKAAERKAVEAERVAKKLAAVAQESKAVLEEATTNAKNARNEAERLENIARDCKRKAAKLAEEAKDADCEAAELAEEIEEAERRRKLFLGKAKTEVYCGEGNL